MSTPKADPFVARIKPYNKAAGHLTQTYTIFSRKWEASIGWYEVDEQMARDLFKVTIDGSTTGTKVFDVLRQSAARRLDAKAREEAARQRARDASNPMPGSAAAPSRTMTTRDLRAEEEAFQRATGGTAAEPESFEDIADAPDDGAYEDDDLNATAGEEIDPDQGPADAPAPPAPRLPGAPAPGKKAAHGKSNKGR